MHIDADDQWEPYLTDFVELFHELEIAAGEDFHLGSQQTGIGKRDLLLNLALLKMFTGVKIETSMMKLANRGLLMFMDYSVYRKRLSRPRSKQFGKVEADLFSQMLFLNSSRRIRGTLFQTQLLALLKKDSNLPKNKSAKALLE